MFLLVPALLMTACEPQALTTGVTKISVPASREAEDLGDFWKQFQEAVGSGDREAVARLTRFPLKCDLSTLDEFKDVGSRAGFQRHFQTLFPKEVVATLARTPAPDRNEKLESGHRSWSITHHEDHEVSEQEWSIGYVFEELPDGAIRLTAIHLAG